MGREHRDMHIWVAGHSSRGRIKSQWLRRALTIRPEGENDKQISAVESDKGEHNGHRF